MYVACAVVSATCTSTCICLHFRLIHVLLLLLCLNVHYALVTGSLIRNWCKYSGCTPRNSMSIIHNYYVYSVSTCKTKFYTSCLISVSVVFVHEKVRQELSVSFLWLYLEFCVDRDWLLHECLCRHKGI